MLTEKDIERDLADLVGFNTVSSRSNIELIDWAEHRFESHGAHCVRIPNADGTKQNLWARFGPEEPGGIALSGHTDVVPVEGQDWVSDPFQMVERGDKLFGRGTSDMKCFIAFCAAYAPIFSQIELNRAVHIALSYDEEVGCIGAPSMIEKMGQNGMRPALAWIGEPTNWRVVSGHKGIVVTKVEVTGLEAHSSQTHLGVSAIGQAVTLLSKLQDISEDLKSLGEPDGLFEPSHPTLTIGQINGGTASNILAHTCEFVFDLRCLQGIDPDEILQPFFDLVATLNTEMARDFPGTGIKVTRLCNAPPLAIDHDSEAEHFVRSITGDNAKRAVAYAAEAGQFSEANIPALLCGPGSIDQAHRPNEFIARSELTKGLAVFDTLIQALET